MDSAGNRIEQLFEQIDATPFGPAERALIDEAISLADENGLDELGYAARLRLLPSASMLGDTDAQLSAFAWCVGRNAADPDRFPLQVGGFDLLWYHKHVVSSLMGSPLFSLADVDAAIEAMQQQYVKEGVGVSGVLQARFQASVGQGRLDQAGVWLGELKRTPRDDYSHCETCVRAEEAEYHYTIGKDADGLALADEILGQGMTCGDEPENTIAQALLPLLRAGRLDEARQLHLRGYRMARGNADHLPMIAQHLRFCAVTGNAGRGLEILERHLNWLVHDGLNAEAHFGALSAAAVLLGAAERAGAGAQTVTAASDPRLRPVLGERDEPWTVSALRVAARRAAADLGARFDERNGNSFYASRLAADDALAEVSFDLPIGATRVSGDSVPAPLPDDLDGRMTLAADLLAMDERGQARQVVAAIEALGEAPGGEPLTAAQIAGIAGLKARLEAAGESDEALAAIFEAAAQDGLDAALAMTETALADPELEQGRGRGRRAALLRTRAQLLGADDEFDAGLAAADASLAIGLRLGAREWASTTAVLGAHLAQDAGKADLAIERWRIAIREAAMAELPQELSARLELGSLLAALGRAEEGVEEAREVLRRQTASGAPGSERAETLRRIGQGYVAMQEYQDALSAYRDAVALASQAQDWLLATRSALALGELMTDAGDPDGIAVLAGAVESARQLRATDDDDPMWLIRSMHLHGRALSLADEDEQAAVVLREAIEEAAVAAGNEHPAAAFEHADLLDSLARALGADHPEEAVRAAQESAAEFARIDETVPAGRALMLAAGVHHATDRPEAAIPLMEQAIEVLADHPEVLGQVLNAAGEVYEKLGRHHEAKQVRDRAQALG
ncbi:tetratricopeptide repeat protein [Kineosporia sp. J2-2]|uniref:Tetratricopeptide repeat protein n=1 Tax=Kineosporia corallincola TaxID=2835133 RepID=A0ABS5TNC5_9ACTN|nr:tetratricopeptide repeat protein [Kineosporia corallincola]MBT0772495.1 tetratricopeptide repeat protein [Kineosporia corallincola]